LTTLLAFAFVLGVLVFVHELGHFVAAKRVGIRVLKFQLGFNPTIVSFKRGDTEYGIGALPLGGYVKMAGEQPEDARTGKSDEFLSKTKWERFQVLVMGPVMNLGLAVVLLAVVLYQGVRAPVFESEPPTVGVVLRDSPAERAGVQRGDRIVAIAGREVENWEQFFLGIGTRPNREVEMTVLRQGRQQKLKVTPITAPDSRFEIGEIGVLPDVHPRLLSVNEGEPGHRDGLRPGDVILNVDGDPITFATHFRREIAKRPEQAMTVEVLRDGNTVPLTITPMKKGDIGWLGVTPSDETKVTEPGLFQAFGMSVSRNIEMSGFIFTTIWDLLRGQTSPKQLMGPVGIAQLSGESAQLGWVALVSLMAQLSLNLGLLNLLPIPILDGGHILIMGLEGVARRDFSSKVKEKMLLAGFVVLMMLMVTVIYNDLTRISWIERLMPWR
jgi:regulator of sigma E protease